MNFSYDYKELIDELQSDINEGLLSLSGTLKVVRGNTLIADVPFSSTEKVSTGYKPIIDYYYDDYQPNELYEELMVSDVIKEMEHYNKIIK